MAVSSESYAHKQLRYQQISKVFEGDQNISIHDIGMGLSDYYFYLKQYIPMLKFEYSGSDILEEYCVESKIRCPDQYFYLRDISEKPYQDRYDYIIMSGLFHQRRNTTIPQWERYSHSLISNAFAMCNKGIAFNYITSFVDFYQTEVYYCNIPKLLNFIVDRLSRYFVILHNYALYELTILVYREEHVRSMYKQPEFQKYFKA